MDTFKLQLGSPIIPPFVEATLQCELAKSLQNFIGFLQSRELVELRPCDRSATTKMLNVNIV